MKWHGELFLLTLVSLQVDLKINGLSKKRAESGSNIWWGNVNKPISPEIFDDLYTKAISHFNSLDECYLFDGYELVKNQKKSVGELTGNNILSPICLLDKNKSEFIIFNRLYH